MKAQAPDFNGIPAAACQTPNPGYDDRNQRHIVEWAADFSRLITDRAAQRAEEEYNKAALAFRPGNPAFYLGVLEQLALLCTEEDCVGAECFWKFRPV